MNLVIAPAGDKSLHKKWLTGKPNFELVLLYYGDNLEVAKSYTKDTPHVYASKGFKWWLIKSDKETKWNKNTSRELDIVNLYSEIVSNLINANTQNNNIWKVKWTYNIISI